MDTYQEVPLAREMHRGGTWMFRWRSYAPLPLLALIAFELRHYQYLGRSHTIDLAWECLCLGVGAIGIAIRAHVVGHAPANTSGRNTERGQVAEQLVTTGLYSVVRNPLYLGNAFLWLGAALFLHDWRIVLLASAFFFLLYERIVLVEESYLSNRFGSAFATWAGSTPAFLPRLRGYVRPNLPFSWRHVLRREYSGVFGFVAVLFALEVVGDLHVYGRLHFDPPWVVLFGASCVAYLVLRSLKHHTNLLDVPGR
jgi:protein-S-isoprenylcysteine O-methyltransferase Ste14